MSARRAKGWPKLAKAAAVSGDRKTEWWLSARTACYGRQPAQCFIDITVFSASSNQRPTQGVYEKYLLVRGHINTSFLVPDREIEASSYQVLDELKEPSARKADNLLRREFT